MFGFIHKYCTGDNSKYWNKHQWSTPSHFIKRWSPDKWNPRIFSSYYSLIFQYLFINFKTVYHLSSKTIHFLKHNWLLFNCQYFCLIKYVFEKSYSWCGIWELASSDVSETLQMQYFIHSFCSQHPSPSRDD